MALHVVPLRPEDWPRWRALRLAALAEAPEAFGSTLADWTGAGDTEGRWRSRLTAVPHNLVLVRDGRDVAQVSLAAPEAGAPPELVSLWVAPEARGTGAGDLAVRAVLDLATEIYPGRGVVLSVRAANAAAVRLYARHGFVDAGVSPDDRRERRMIHRSAAPPG